jgi:hypothetical protein
MYPEEHQRTATYLDGVADQHHPPLGHGVGKSPDKSRQQHIGQGEEQLEERFVFLGGLHLPEYIDGGDQQGIVGQRREELRRHDHVETEGHRREMEAR